MQSKFPIIVLSVSLIALGIAAYALTQVQSTPPAVPATGPRVSFEDAVSDLEARLAAIEEARLREHGASALDSSIRDRLDDLDRRMDALGAPRDESRPPAGASASDAPAATRVADDEPSLEDIERFRRLQAAASRHKRAMNDRDRIDRAVAKHGVTLTAKQRERLGEAYKAFESRRAEIWMEMKRRGTDTGPNTDWAAAIAETQRAIVAEFAEKISEFLPRGDAENISRTLLSGGK